MTTDDQAAGHRAHLERLCAEGGPLTAHSRHATTQNPEWFNVKRQQPRQERRALHNEILADFVASRPEVLRNRKAIVLAGPPGAGKSTAQNALIAATRTRPENWLPINPDDFKDELLLKAREDGSYAGYLIPDEVRELEAAGERFYPRELAALVHNESAILAKKAIRDAIDRGDNIIIDGTLSGEKNARAQLEALQAAGYDVKVADVETTQTVSEARILARWERGYLDAEEGLATGREAELGGRWVPRSFSAGLFTTAGAADSVCAANALMVATDYGCVSEYLVYRVADKDSAPELEQTQGRARPDGTLVDGETLAAVRASTTPRAPQQRGQSTGKDFGR
ncbi:zeta toxin family protein [Paenarthrobacter ureafaciens]|uniref:zeta toxin family protein n=1 Tax=Paenarthrobacter ureafaciens TaxID=37931 RepID=UPI00140C0785|nr:zeta toxin family protein [Paenarthrobacter ureafaciens]MCX8455118.1 zeta toxin family protein [Paenarthrobacter ureafaciens]MCY0974532.1 zeta toxin family protein [Paenarthrobacter ureafaciens]